MAFRAEERLRGEQAKFSSRPLSDDKPWTGQHIAQINMVLPGLKLTTNA